MARLLGIMLLMISLIMVWQIAQQRPVPGPLGGSAPIEGQQLAAPENAPAPQAGNDCRVVGDGYVGGGAVIGHPDASFVHVSYYVRGEGIDRSVLLTGSQFVATTGIEGRYRAYSDCIEYARGQMEGHMTATDEGPGDPSLFGRP